MSKNREQNIFMKLILRTSSIVANYLIPPPQYLPIYGFLLDTLDNGDLLKKSRLPLSSTRNLLTLPAGKWGMCAIDTVSDIEKYGAQTSPPG